MWRSQSDIHRHREAEVGRASVALREVVCEVCSRTFRRESDCSSLLVSSVGRSSVRCAGGEGGLAVHVCRPGD